MGLWDRNTQQDTSTPEERRAWRDRAKAQMAEQKRAEQGIPRTPPPAPGSQHRTARRPK
jgi:hypothetical protein